MRRKYKVMVLQDDGIAKVYETEDSSMHKAISVIEQIHAFHYSKDKFRVTYIEEIIE